MWYGILCDANIILRLQKLTESMHLVEVQSLDIYARRILILYRAINERNGLTRNIVGGRLWCACLHVIRITIGKKKTTAANKDVFI